MMNGDHPFKSTAFYNLITFSYDSECKITIVNECNFCSSKQTLHEGIH